MKADSYSPGLLRRLTLAAFSAALGVVWIAAPAPERAEAGTLVIPAWSFDRGNVRIDADPDKCADAGPVVVSGERAPWGWSVEYDVDLPVAGRYTLQIRYATKEVRPVQIFFDSRDMGKCCTRVSLAPPSGDNPNSPTSRSSGAVWQTLRNRFGAPASLATVRNGTATAGKHKLVLTSLTPLPNLVAIRLETDKPFPESWNPPQYKVRDIDSVPARRRKLLVAPGNIDAAALRAPAKRAKQYKPGASLDIPAWTFDRGNVRIYASPDKYADAGPVAGGAPEKGDRGTVEYDIEFAGDGECTLHVSYASDKARPLEVHLDDKFIGICCVGVAFGSAPFEQPIVFTSNSSGAPKMWEGFARDGKLVRIPVTRGKRTLKLTRKGAMPNLLALRVSSSASFAKGSARRKMAHFGRVPARDRSVFLPPDAVNIAALRESISDMIETYGPNYPRGSEHLKRLDELDKKPRTICAVWKGKDAAMTRVWAGQEDKPQAQQAPEIKLAALRREAMLDNPELKKFDKLLFVKRTPFGGHIYEGHHQKSLGGGLCVLSPVSADGKVTEIAPEMSAGRFSRFDLSFDAKKVVFGYRTKDKPFRIYEMGVDGKGLRQLTFDTPFGDEAARRNSRHAFEDTDPCYLPDGKIMFVSTRSMQNVFCFPAAVTNLYVMDSDGKNLRRISSSPLTEMDPCLLDDGRVAYTRWEYVDKGLGNGQSLWAVRPDGSGVDHVYKNSITRPSGMLQPRSIPGSRQIVTVASSHMSRQGGPVILIDNRITRRTPEAMTCITPEIGYPCMYTAKWHMGYFLEPHPFSEKFFLVSHIPGVTDPKSKIKPKYGLYALDAWGNRAKIYGDPKISCSQPTPLIPRRRPTRITGGEPVVADKNRHGTMFIHDVYEGMTGIKRGRVKYVRVMGVLPWPWSENGIFRLGLAGNVHRKKVYGVAKVHEDGSAFFTVPARENILFQALDENFMLLQHMPTFINVMPGENRSCIGCHEHRNKAPNIARSRPQAAKHAIQALAPQPGDSGPRMVHYASDVQPVLDKHCVSCHGADKPRGRLDLTGAPTDMWSRSYENILGRGLVSSRHCGFGRSGFRPTGPLTFGSHLSKLAARIRSAPCKAKITPSEFVRIITWIDANTPYYGTYRGRRDLRDKDHPDFRLPPVVAARPR